MQRSVPLFPLNTVVFPGLAVPLNVFEDRYRALVHRLLRINDPTERLFATVAIREGYEVGERIGQSVHRVGCLLQLLHAEEHEDGSFSLETVARDRVSVLSIGAADPFLSAEVELLTDTSSPAAQARAPRLVELYEEYRGVIAEVRGHTTYPSPIPDDATYLAWVLAATCHLQLADRQQILEAQSTEQRLTMLEGLIAMEMRAMRAVPSLPATEIARTRWSPN